MTRQIPHESFCSFPFKISLDDTFSRNSTRIENFLQVHRLGFEIHVNKRSDTQEWVNECDALLLHIIIFVFLSQPTREINNITARFAFRLEQPATWHRRINHYHHTIPELPWWSLKPRKSIQPLPSVRTWIVSYNVSNGARSIFSHSWISLKATVFSVAFKTWQQQQHQSSNRRSEGTVLVRNKWSVCSNTWFARWWDMVLWEHYFVVCTDWLSSSSLAVQILWAQTTFERHHWYQLKYSCHILTHTS